MADYDNTDKGAAFKPFQDQSLVLQGKINDGGSDRKVVLVKDKTKSGKTIIEIFEKVGVLFANERRESDKAPDYTGNLSGPAGSRRIAAWKRMKDGSPYMTFGVSDNQKKEDESSNQTERNSIQEELDDDLPPF